MGLTHIVIRTSACIIFYLVVLAGCSDSTVGGDSNGTDQPPPEPPPTEDVSYSEHIQPIFNAHCNQCHGGTQGESGVVLTSYSSVMNSIGNCYQMNIVVAGEPDESPLVDKVENDNPACGERMPFGGTLNNDQIQAIRTWIEEGAENN